MHKFRSSVGMTLLAVSMGVGSLASAQDRDRGPPDRNDRQSERRGTPDRSDRHDGSNRWNNRDPRDRVA